MPTNTWISPTPSTWSTPASWSLGHVPTATEDVVFDATGVGNCAIDVGISVLSLIGTSAYTGNVVGAPALTHAIGVGGLDYAGTGLVLGAGSTWNCSGSFNRPPHANDNYSGATVNLSGAGKMLGSIGVQGSIVAVNMTGSYTATAEIVGATVVVSGTMTANNAALYSGTTLSVSSTGLVNGSGLAIQLESQITQQAGTVSCPITVNATAAPSGFIQLVAGRYDGNVALFADTGPGNFTHGPGTYVYKGNFTSSSDIITIHNEGNNPDIDFWGNVGLGTATTWTRGTGTITLRGTSGTQTIDFGSSTGAGVNRIETTAIDAAGATKRLLNPFFPFTAGVENGTLDVNGQLIGATAAPIVTFQVDAPGQITPGSVGNLTTANFFLNGTTLNPITWTSSVVRTLTVLNSGIVHHVTASNSNASSGAAIDATDGTSTDSGGNTNWNFVAPPPAPVPPTPRAQYQEEGPIELEQFNVAQKLRFRLFASNNATPVATAGLGNTFIGAPITGASPNVIILRESDATFISPAGTVTELQRGYYSLSANAFDANALGTVKLLAWDPLSNSAVTEATFQVVAVGTGSAPTVEQIRAEMDANSTMLYLTEQNTLIIRDTLETTGVFLKAGGADQIAIAPDVNLPQSLALIGAATVGTERRVGDRLIEDEMNNPGVERASANVTTGLRQSVILTPPA